MSAPVQLKIEGAIATLTLWRPDKLNALDPEAIGLISEAVDRVASDAQVRALIITGEGRAFCAGADLAALGPFLESADAFDSFLTQWNDAFDLLESCPIPTIAGVNGITFAGGLELTHVCDFVVVGEDVILGDQHAMYGLFPAGGGLQRLARLVGVRRAKWLVMSGERLTAEAAYEWGLVNQVVPNEDVMRCAREMAEHLAQRSSALNEQIKRGLREDVAKPLREAHGDRAAARGASHGVGRRSRWSCCIPDATGPRISRTRDGSAARLAHTND